MQTLSRQQYCAACRGARLTEELKIFSNLVKKVAEHVERSYHLSDIAPDNGCLLFLDVYYRILCPLPDGNDRYFIDQLGDVFDIVFANHPAYLDKLKDYWVESWVLAVVKEDC